MEVENIINLFDSYWYEIDLFKNTKPKYNSEIPKLPLSKNSNIINNIPTISTINEKISLNPSKTSVFSASPNSVLQTQKLQTIFSGKNAEEFDENASENSSKGSLVISHKIKRKKKRLSKSLSDLEYEELKGFMDLGFVFSEDDKDSELASIIPGLQRLDNSRVSIKNNGVDAAKDDIHDLSLKPISIKVSRPYLSEAWEESEKKRRESNYYKWKVPISSSQIDMKDNIKSWAHNVASMVR